MLIRGQSALSYSHRRRQSNGSSSRGLSFYSVPSFSESRFIGCVYIHEGRLHTVTLQRRGSICDVVSEPRDRRDRSRTRVSQKLDKSRTAATHDPRNRGTVRSASQ